MPPFSYGEENWFHSRSSSSEEERNKIILLVQKSKEMHYAGLRWGGSKKNPLVIQFANEISVNPATMQTKIRAFIRLGFIREKDECPLNLTFLGEIWQDLINRGLYSHADVVEKLMIASSLVIYAFDSEGYTKNPHGNYRPIYELLNKLDSKGFISTNDLKKLIGGKAETNNFSYWKKDLIRSGLFRVITGGIIRTKNFKKLEEAIKTAKLPPKLSERDWKDIHNNVLDNKNPYKNVIVKELDGILENLLDIEAILSHEEKNIIAKLTSVSDDKELLEIEKLGDYNIPETYTKTKTRKKQSAWSKIIKKAYNYSCCVPACDISSPFLTISAHIKSYSAKESKVGHRANPKNGLCFCPLCHALFDKGYFTLTNDLKIHISSKIKELGSDRIKEIFELSNGRIINPLPPDPLKPDPEFIRFHRKNIFLD